MIRSLIAAAILALPLVASAQGVPENCRAPMANDLETTGIPRLLHIPDDGPQIMGIVPTGNAHAREIGKDLYRLDCTISVAWSDGHVDRNYRFSVWDKPDGHDGGSYGPPNKKPPVAQAKPNTEPHEKLSQDEFDKIASSVHSKIEAGTVIPGAVEIILQKMSDASCPAPYKFALFIPTDHSKPTNGGCWARFGDSVDVRPNDGHPPITLPSSMFRGGSSDIAQFTTDVMDAGRRFAQQHPGN